MSTARWIIMSAVSAAASFFGGVFFGQSLSQPIIDTTVNREREYQEAWDSLDQRDKEWSAALQEHRAPNPPPRYEPFGGHARRD
jgi:hypothetical protein